MTAMTLTSARRTTWPVGFVLGFVAGGCLVVAGIWNALIQDHVTVAAPPAYQHGAPLGQALQDYYRWYAGTVGQERADTILALVGVAGLVLVAGALRRRLDDFLGRIACTALALGGAIWMVGAIAEIGGHHAVSLMATHHNPIQTVNAISFTVDMTANAFEAAAFVLLGCAMVAIGVSPVRVAGSRWTLLTVLTGIVAFVVAFGYVRENDVITAWVLGLLAAVLLPAWLVITGRVLDAAPN
jgi:hypothetical protein